jgi:hypothetical protein
MTDGSRAAYATLHVYVAQGKVAAQNVEVQVFDWFELKSRPGFPRNYHMPRVNGQSLAWSDTDPPATRLTVASGTYRPLDLVSVRQPDAISGNASARIEVSPKPAGDRNHVKSAQWRLGLVLMADNVDPRVYLVNASYDGEWGDGDAIGEHLSIEQPVPFEWQRWPNFLRRTLRPWRRARTP